MTELILLNNNERIEVDEKYGVSTEGSISDIRDLDSVSGASSKSLFITSNDDVNRIFNGIFNINAETLLFDQTVKQECELWHNGEKIMKGYFQILNIQYVDRNQYIYELIIFDEQVNFFLEIEENLLTGNDDTSKDLDFSQYDHIWNLDNVQDSWVKNSDDLPYYYFLGNQGKSSWTDVEDFKPGFYIKNIIENIFYKYDYKLKSDFFETDLFKEIFIPFSTGEGLPLIDEQEIEDRKFEAENDNCNLYQTDILNTTLYPASGMFPDFMNWGLPFVSNPDNPKQARSSQYIPFNNIINQGTNGLVLTGGCSNAPNGWNDISRISGINNKIINQNIRVEIDGRISIRNYSTGTIISRNEDEGGEDNYMLKVDLRRINDTNQTLTQGLITNSNSTLIDSIVVNLGEITPVAGKSNPGDPNVVININKQTSVTFENIDISENEYVITYSLQRNLWKFQSSSQDPYESVDQTFQILGTTGTKVSNEPLSTSVREGDELFINQWLPENMKQKDLLRSVFKMFNLKMMPDINEERTLIIEPRDDFYTSGKIIDCNNNDNFYIIDKPSNYQLVTDFQAKDIIFKYLDDGDSDEDDMGKKRLLSYKNKYKREYGEQRILFDNENLRDTRTITPDFASTVTGYSDTINDTEITDGGSKYICGDIKAELPENQPRILFRNLLPNQFPYVVGDKTRVFRKFTDLVNPLAVDLITGAPYELVQMNEYGTGTHYREDPFFPTFDLNFGRVRELLYNPNILTDNNLYNSFWINEISSIDEQKMLTAYFYISNSDFKNLSYNDLLYFDKNDYSSYYIINKIIEYNVKTGETKLELLTFDPTLKFDREPQRPVIDKNPTNPSPDLPGVNVGSGNIVKSPGSITTGNNNINNGGFIKGGNNINDNGFIYGNDNTNLGKTNILGDNNIVGDNSKINTIIGNDNEITEDNDTKLIVGDNINDNDLREGYDAHIGDISIGEDIRVGDISYTDGGMVFKDRYVENGYVENGYVTTDSGGFTMGLEEVYVEDGYVENGYVTKAGDLKAEFNVDNITFATDIFRLPNLPTSSTGLPVGAVWRDGTDLKIVI